MRQVILIHAHHDLGQLNALVSQLLDDDFLIYVNVDAKSAIDVGALHPAARLVAPRVAIHWGRSACADELFFQTLVMNSPFGARVVPDNFRRIQWAGTRHPKVLDESDFAAIGASRAHFCRKLDVAARAGLLPLLQRLRDSREP